MTRPKSHLQGVKGSGQRWLPTCTVCARYDISETTLTRWVNRPGLGFPKPMKVTSGGGNFYNAAELDEFDLLRAEQTKERREEQAKSAQAERTSP